MHRYRCTCMASANYDLILIKLIRIQTTCSCRTNKYNSANEFENYRSPVSHTKFEFPTLMPTFEEISGSKSHRHLSHRLINFSFSPPSTTSCPTSRIHFPPPYYDHDLHYKYTNNHKYTRRNRLIAHLFHLGFGFPRGLLGFRLP